MTDTFPAPDQIIVTRGPGETQLEVDRRDIIRRISKLKDELEHVREHRAQHRRLPRTIQE